MQSELTRQRRQGAAIRAPWGMEVKTMHGKTNLQLVRHLFQESLAREKVENDLDNIPKPEPQVEPNLGTLLKDILAELKRSNKTPLSKIESPWLTLTEAAAYLRFSPRYFRDITKQYQIPRHGPDKNRFNKYELDEWIDEPDRFKTTMTKPARRKEGYKIHNLLNEIVQLRPF